MLDAWSRQSGKQPPSDLGDHLRRIRKAGFDKSSSYLVKGVVNISFPVLNVEGSAVAALTIPFIQYTQPSLSAADVTGLLREAAAEISQAIGGRV
jgi:DNA-binding IclR family transcriptional regulator